MHQYLEAITTSNPPLNISNEMLKNMCELYLDLSQMFVDESSVRNNLCSYMI